MCHAKSVGAPQMSQGHVKVKWEQIFSVSLFQLITTWPNFFCLSLNYQIMQQVTEIKR